MSRRITIAMVGMILGTLLVAGIGTIVTSRIAGRTTELRDLRERADQIADLIPSLVARPADGSNRTTELRADLIEVLDLSGVTQLTIGAKGQVVGEPPAWIPKSRFDLAALRRGETLSGARGNRLWAAAARENDNGSTTVAVVTRTRERLLAPAIQWLIWSSVATLLIGALIAVLLARRLARPVRDAVAITGRIASGDLSARLPVGSGHTAPSTDELSSLTSSINDMADQLERSRALERQFLMSVSHDLRTPLTSIRGYAEALADGVGDRKASAAVILAESQRLERLVADLLDLAKLDARQFGFRFADTELAAVVADAVARIAPVASAAGLDVHVANDPSIDRVRVDPDRLAQAIGNLTSNSLRFARTAVWIRTHPMAHDDGRVGIAVDVADDGPGIDPVDLPHVFERLYQAHRQVAAHEAGSGIGLAIVKELVEGMGGTVLVSSLRDAGTTFTLWFPALP